MEDRKERRYRWINTLINNRDYSTRTIPVGTNEGASVG
jgi:hypothetical protein